MGKTQENKRLDGAQDKQDGSKLHLCTAIEIHDLIRKERVTVQEYARALVERFDERNHEVKAWAHFDNKTILAEAKRLDEMPRASRGPLHGVAIGIKDVLLTKGRSMCTWPRFTVLDSPDYLLVSKTRGS